MENQPNTPQIRPIELALLAEMLTHDTSATWEKAFEIALEACAKAEAFLAKNEPNAKLPQYTAGEKNAEAP